MPYSVLPRMLMLFSNEGRAIPQPDPAVHKLENQIQQSAGLSKLSLSEEQTAVRPNYGTQGKSVILYANAIEIKAPEDLVLHIYHIHLKKVADDTDKKKGKGKGKGKGDENDSPSGKKLEQVVRLFLRSPHMSAYRGLYATDFRSTLIAVKKLGADVFEPTEIVYRPEGEEDLPLPTGTTGRQPAKYTVYVDQVKPTDTRNGLNIDTKSLSIKELLTDLKNCTQTAIRNKSEWSQCLNIFMNHHSKSSPNYTALGKNKSFSLSPGPAEFANFQDGLLAIRGYISSVRPMTGRILGNINVSHGFFYLPGPLRQIMEQPKRGQDKYKLHLFLNRVRVKLLHLPRKSKDGKQEIHRIKTIYGLAEKRQNNGKTLEVPVNGAGPQQVKFYDEKQKKMVSVYDHFNRTYGDDLRSKNLKMNPDLPVVNVGTSSQPSFIPTEFCQIIAGQFYNKMLSPDETANMIEFAVRKPADNFNSIVSQGFATTGLHGNAMLGRIGVTSGKELITVHGRVLNPPVIKYSGGKTIPTTVLSSGSWNIQGMKLVKPGKKLSNWFVLLLDDRTLHRTTLDELKYISQNMLQSMRDAGLEAGPPQTPRRCEFNGLQAQLANAGKAKVDLVFIVMSKSTINYATLKSWGDVIYGVPTVCATKIRDLMDDGKGKMYRANICLKINMKLGGQNHLVDASSLGLISEGTTMVVGIDVTHPSPGSSEVAPSVAAMVASTDRTLAQWPATARVQESRQEEVKVLKDMLKRHLQLWVDKNKTLPKNILIYRDGVSEGQHDMVMRSEFTQLRQACMEVYKGEQPKMTIAIAAKRHHWRFAPTKEGDADKYSNPKPGTVVDRGITDAQAWNFFLQAHAAIQGTARPAQYYFLHDEVFQSYYAAKGKLPANLNLQDMVERVAQGLSFSFGRATKSISICAPARYADMVCDRTRMYLNKVYTNVDGGMSLPEDDAQRMAELQKALDIHPNMRNSMFYV